MNEIILILVLITIVCLSVIIRLFFETLFRENSFRDDIEDKMFFLSEFLNKEFNIFSVKLKPLGIIFLIGIWFAFTVKLILFLW